MYPHERSLVKRLQGKPFAMVGVNTDSRTETLRVVAAREKLTWPQWFDGGVRGPITTAWNVTRFPTIFVMDRTGTIRYKQVRGEKLDRAVDALLAEESLVPGTTR